VQQRHERQIAAAVGVVAVVAGWEQLNPGGVGPGRRIAAAGRLDAGMDA
jgi:hypothetical protein